MSLQRALNRSWPDSWEANAAEGIWGEAQASAVLQMLHAMRVRGAVDVLNVMGRRQQSGVHHLMQAAADQETKVHAAGAIFPTRVDFGLLKEEAECCGATVHHVWLVAVLVTSTADGGRFTRVVYPLGFDGRAGPGWEIYDLLSKNTSAATKPAFSWPYQDDFARMIAEATGRLSRGIRVTNTTHLGTIDTFGTFRTRRPGDADPAWFQRAAPGGTNGNR